MQLTPAPSRLFPRRRQRHTTELAIKRHRARRYEVMSELLSDAAKCLGLEERDVKGFMIMLDSIKTGNTNANSGGAGRGGAGRQPQHKQKTGRGGQRRSAKNSSTSKNTPQNQTADVSSSQRSFFGGGRLRMEAEATQRSTGLMPIAGLAGGMGAEVATASASNAASGRPQMAREDSLNTSYTSGTVDVSGWGDNPADSRSQQRSQGAQAQRESQQQFEQQKQRQEEQMQEQVPAYEASLEDDWTNPGMISPFLSELTPGAGFQSVSLLLLQHLLRSRSGYDARARQVYKRLGVLVLMWEEKARYDVLHEMEASDAGSGFASDAGSDVASEGVEIRTDASGEVLGIQHSPSTGDMSTSFTASGDLGRKRSLRPTDAELAAKATRKFESLERATASKLITLSNQQSSKRRKEKQPAEGDVMSEQHPGAEAASTPHHHHHHQQQQRRSQEPSEASARRQANDQRSRSQQELPQGRQQRRGQHSQRPHAASAPPSGDTAVTNNRAGPRITRAQVMRGLKVGSAGVAAGVSSSFQV